MPTPDPIPIADDMCELLRRAAWPAGHGLLLRHLEHAGDARCTVLAEVMRRGFLPRLLPPGPSVEGEAMLSCLIEGARSERVLYGLAECALAISGDHGQRVMERLVLAAEETGLLRALFLGLIQAGRYEGLRELLRRGGTRESPALRALAEARPDHGKDALNAPAEAAARAGREGQAGEADVLIVPGYTPLDARRPMTLSELPAAQKRLELCARDLKARRAPFVLVSGGSVHPPGTPYNEALMMREYLLNLGVRAEQILVEPHARHTTTNLRNAGRMMLALGMESALIVTGFDRSIFSQAFYLSYPTLSTFAARSQSELGYMVGELSGVDEHHIRFRPAREVMKPCFDDPLDP